MKRLRSHLTYANLTSTLALAIALGMGSAYAADQLADKSVGEPQLRPGAVTAEKIRKHAVTAPKIASLAVKRGKLAVSAEKIANGAVVSAKIPSGAITAEKIPDDSLGGAKIEEASLGQVPAAAHAETATFAESSNPEAFARVSSEGTVFPAAAKGIATADVKQGKEAGIYCVAVAGFSPRSGQVTPEYLSEADVSALIRFGGTESCPAPKVEVRTYSAGVLHKEPFHVVLYR